MSTLSQLEQGIVKFIDSEIAPKIPTNIPNGQIKKIAAVAGAVYAVRTSLGKMVSNPAFIAIGAVDEDGNIDVEGLSAVIASQIPKDGFKVTVPILGDLKFFVEDVEHLKSYILEA